MNGLGADQPYWNALKEGRLQMQQCSGCSKWNWPAVFRCGDCGSWEHAWHDVSPQGTIYSWTRSWYDFGGPREHGLPFVSVVVELESAGNKRLIGTLKRNPALVKIGDRVTGEIINVTFDGEKIPTLSWTLCSEEGKS